MEVHVSLWNVVPYDQPQQEDVRPIGIPDANNIRENRVKLLTLFERWAALDQACNSA
jgi:hypothetical protein